MKELYKKYKGFRATDLDNITGIICGYDDQFLIMAVDSKHDEGWDPKYLNYKNNPFLSHKNSPKGYWYVSEQNIEK